MLTLVAQWRKVPKNSYSCFSKSHIVPKLLSLLCTQTFYSFTFNKSLVLYIEIYLMLMLYLLPMKIYREVILPNKRDIAFIQNYFQCVLIHIFIEIRPQLTMYSLTAAINTITILPQLLKQRGIVFG